MSQQNAVSSHKQRPSRRNLLWVVLVLTALAGVGGFAVPEYFRQTAAPAYRFATVERGTVEKTVTALGSLQPKDYVDVGSQVSGQLKEVHVEIGERVEKDALIAEIDPTVYEIRIRSGEANLENLNAQLVQQKAELLLAQQQLARNQRLLKQRAISQETVEQNEAATKVAVAKIAATQAQIKAAKAGLEEDRANLGYTKIYAPLSGTVVTESAVAGQTINASQSAPEIVRIANLETMTVWAEVAEADIARIKAGMPAYFTTLGEPNRRWTGTVRQVLPTPETVNDVVLYNVLIDVDNREQRLMTDMTVQVFFVQAVANDVPVVPMSALQATDTADTYQVQIMGAQGPETRSVQIGVSNRTTAEVLSGLDLGAQVITGQQAANNPAADKQRPSMGPRL